MTATTKSNLLNKLVAMLVMVTYLISAFSGFVSGQAFASSSVGSYCEMDAGTQHGDECMSSDSKGTTNHHDDCDDASSHCGYSGGLELPNKVSLFPNTARTNKFAAQQDSSTQTSPDFPDRPPRA
ncbi:MAG: hypothetical protein ACI8P9_003208 [Parasphingorhabdus sp.]|jgi:hypothetical protein